jgi:hypothetical protein
MLILAAFLAKRHPQSEQNLQFIITTPSRHGQPPHRQPFQLDLHDPAAARPDPYQQGAPPA